MILVKVNATDYISPDKVIRISREKDDVDKNVWTIYTEEGKVKTYNNFNIKAFIRKCR